MSRWGAVLVMWCWRILPALLSLFYSLTVLFYKTRRSTEAALIVVCRDVAAENPSSAVSDETSKIRLLIAVVAEYSSSEDQRRLPFCLVLLSPLSVSFSLASLCLKPRSSIVIIYRYLGTRKATWGNKYEYARTYSRYSIFVVFACLFLFFGLVRIGRATGQGEPMKRRPPEGLLYSAYFLC